LVSEARDIYDGKSLSYIYDDARVSITKPQEPPVEDNASRGLDRHGDHVLYLHRGSPVYDFCQWGAVMQGLRTSPASRA
jgi:hypothetical protein